MNLVLSESGIGNCRMPPHSANGCWDKLTWSRRIVYVKCVISDQISIQKQSYSD